MFEEVTRERSKTYNVRQVSESYIFSKKKIFHIDWMREGCVEDEDMAVGSSMMQLIKWRTSEQCLRPWNDRLHAVHYLLLLSPSASRTMSDISCFSVSASCSAHFKRFGRHRHCTQYGQDIFEECGGLQIPIHHGPRYIQDDVLDELVDFVIISHGKYQFIQGFFDATKESIREAWRVAYFLGTFWRAF